jgi:energy-coupling factor transport system ATP-binding protein
VIEAKNVYFTYESGVEALKGVSLEIHKEEFVAIMGQNGAGKTTLVKHFNGLFKPTKGEIFVDDVSTREVSVAQLARKVGLVFQNQDHQLFCSTVDEEVAFALQNFGFKKKAVKKRVTWALNLLDLTRYRDVSPFMLSGGERKRVALASVLAWNPDYIILDEPTIGQDYNQKEKLRQFIIQLKNQGKSVIIVTHDVEFVAMCTPRVVLMSKGRILADGDAKDVLTNLNITEEASILPPQVTQIFLDLTHIGFPNKLINVYDSEKALTDYLEGS